MILFINACVKKDSRTKRLADNLLTWLDGDVVELCLKDVLFPVIDEKYLKHRDELISSKNFEHQFFDYARQFASADTIVIAALKQYLEIINVIGITFKYTADGLDIVGSNPEKILENALFTIY